MDIDENVGFRGKWVLPLDEGLDFLSVEGLYLGFASSESKSHNPQVHPQGPEGPFVWKTSFGRKLRCNGCRWTEFRLFREETDGKPVDNRPYLLHLMGMSSIPGETTRHKFEEWKTALEIIELLTIRRAGNAYLSIPAGRLLAQAASYDNGELKDAYMIRRVR